MLDVAILTVSPELTQDEFESLLCLVSADKQEKVKRYRFFRDARNSLLGDVLARKEICRTTGLRNDELAFSENFYGKPFLENYPSVHCNISHTGNYIACAISDKCVGIDIELIKPIDIHIAERFFSPEETAYIKQPDDQYQNRYRFFEVWTKKESRVKWEGMGLSKPLPSFSVLYPDETEQIAYFKVFENDEAICHVCASCEESPIVRVLDTTEFTSLSL
ncbi:MAG: 4'-phosphopantetheinyl transferase superfamily protein [Oscillospiraceae bacterium]|nr:4'-phosphopantetheinyl transferase superfamily protein [Oscillospiraceae bacterium]